MHLYILVMFFGGLKFRLKGMSTLIESKGISLNSSSFYNILIDYLLMEKFRDKIQIMTIYDKRLAR